MIGRPDITPEGNRVAAGRGGLGQVTPVDVDLPGTPTWVLPVSDPSGELSWYVTLEDETPVVVDKSGDITSAGVDQFPTTDLQPFDNPLPDGRSVGDGTNVVALVEPTDRYPHGVLGDRIEAAAIQVLNPVADTSITFGPAAPTVIEGISPLLADIDLDGEVDILVTHSNADVGAWLAVWRLDGTLMAESAPIGQGNRWRNQLAVASTGPNGELEIVDVRTPHLGKTVEYFRLDGDRLELVADLQGFTSHTLGSRNLDLGIVADGNGDGELDVILPTGDLSKLGVLTRVDDEVNATGVEVTALLDLPGRLTTNVAAGTDDQRNLGFAIGTDQEVLRIWPGP